MQTMHNIQSIKTISNGVANQIQGGLGHFTSKLIPRSRKGMSAPLTVVSVLAVGGLLVGGGFWLAGQSDDGETQGLSFVDPQTGQKVDEKGEPLQTGINLLIANACPDDKQVDFQTRIKNNKKTGTAEYLNATGYLIASGTENDPLSYTTVDSSYPTAITPRCDGQTSYTFTTVAKNETAFTMSQELGLLSADVKKTFEAEKFGRIDVKIKDVLNDAWVYANNAGSATAYNTTPVTFESTTDNQTATALAADTQVQYQFWMKTPASTQFGEDELDLFIAVDADTTDYEIPSLSLDGIGLQDVKNSGALNSIDLSVLSGYEYVFKVPDSMRFTSSNRILTFDVISKAGVNPDVDIKIRPLAETRYLAQDGVTIKTGIFKDDSGNSEAASDLSQEITVDIS